jgi:hypothetical protein
VVGVNNSLPISVRPTCGSDQDGGVGGSFVHIRLLFALKLPPTRRFVKGFSDSGSALIRISPRACGTTEVTERRCGQRLWVNKQGTVTLHSLLVRAEVLSSVVPVRSVVNFFFAAGEDDGA